MRSAFFIASAGSSSSGSAGSTSGSLTRLCGSPLSTSGTTSATSVAVSWSAVSLAPSAAPVSPAPVSTSAAPRSSKRASSRSMAEAPSSEESRSLGSRGSVTGISSLSWGVQARDGSAEDGEHALGEEQVEAGHQRDHERHEDDDDGRVGDQLAPARPDDLAQLGDDLAQEAGEAPLLPLGLRTVPLGLGAGAGALTRPADRSRGRAGDPPRVGRVVLVVVGGDASPPTSRRRCHDLVLLGRGLRGDLVLGGLELPGVVDPGGLTVELLVGQLGVGDDCVVLAARLLVAHCASLASWWRPLAGEAVWSVGSCRAVAGVTGLEPAA